ncbi:MAG: helix-turn-helix domain-containing protein [Thiobacillus sp.]|nr:helix-turn-helix domain-containing protein [Thiobacillus sp.]
MDRRYKPLTLSQQMELRRQVMEDLLSHPEWSLQEAVCHMKKGLRLTTAELAKLAGVSFRTVQNIERGVSLGTVQTLSRILGVLGLRLSVAQDSGQENRTRA